MSAHVWVNGRDVTAAQGHVSALDGGLSYGLGAFEVFRSCGKTAPTLSQHLQRLRTSLDHLGIACGSETLVALSNDVASALAAQTASSDGDLYVRVMVTEGDVVGAASAPLGPLRIVVVAPIAPASQAHALDLAQAPVDRSHGFKTLSYAAHVRALRLARARGCTDALWVDSDGFLDEGATSNLFVVRATGEILTSDAPNIRKGVTREAVLELAHHAGMTVRFERPRLDALADYREIFITSSIRELVSIETIREGEEVRWRGHTDGTRAHTLLTHLRRLRTSGQAFSG